MAIERVTGVEGLVVVGAHGPVRYAEGVASHAPWITAFDVECIGGEEIGRIPEALAPLKAAVAGLSRLAIRNQGLIDKRERSEVIQTLTYLRDHGIRLDPDGAMVEALRKGWGGTGPEQLRALALDLRTGKHLKFSARIAPELLDEWLTAE